MNPLTPHSLPGARGKAVLARGLTSYSEPRPCRSSCAWLSESCVSNVALADQPLRQIVSAETVVSAVSAAGDAPVDDERCAGQRLERGLDVAVGVVVMRPGKTAAQHQGGVRQRHGLLAAQAEFGNGSR